MPQLPKSGSVASTRSLISYKLGRRSPPHYRPGMTSLETLQIIQKRLADTSPLQIIEELLPLARQEPETAAHVPIHFRFPRPGSSVNPLVRNFADQVTVQRGQAQLSRASKPTTHGTTV